MRALGLLLALSLASTAASAAPPATRPVQFAKLILKLEAGAPYGKLKVGLLCMPGSQLKWKTGRHDIRLDDFEDEFESRMKTAGFDVVGGEADMFDPDAGSRAEYLVGATIKRLDVDACAPHSGLGNKDSVKGRAALDTEWYIYSRLDRKVVARVPTSAEFRRGDADLSGVTGLVAGAFGENLARLIAGGILQTYLSGPPIDPLVARVADPKFAPLRIPLSPSRAMPLKSVVGSTILVFAGNGHGSGFLISREGYFLTNQHVVGRARYVKLRWPDGVEGVGEVLRTDNGRDVALIRGDARGRAPLPISTQSPDVGGIVYAVGAPLDPRLQGTMTMGIVSAKRVREGYNVIQADVAVTHGNSGGPLVNDKGAVVGITTSGIAENGAPVSLNFFVPIKEGLDFLAAHPAP